MTRWMIGLICVCLSIASHAQPQGIAAAAQAPQSIESFFDGAVGAQVASGEIIGATVALVQDGAVVFTKGYGLANREQSVPVVSDRTLFRIGSISKVFVWVAVMQQVAAGRLDLYADVNSYLQDFEIPATYPVPVTLRHLMTHTAGFEDRVLGLFASGPRTVGDFHANLVSMRPARVFMPGKVAAYSNYGSALAAHLVEIVAKQPWEDYVEQRILTPLDMLHTSPRQPLPQDLADSMANGYWKERGVEVAAPFEFVSIPPAGSISATATDMASFMLELLAKGDTPVLTAAAREKLFEPGFSADPRINGVLHGLYEMSSHGQRIVGHGGDTIAFHSELRLYPKQRMGLFISTNSETGAAARDAVVAAFDDRMFGVPARPQPRSSTTVLDRFTGTYSPMRVPMNGPARIMGLLGSVSLMVDDGGLIVPGTDGPQRLIEIGDRLFSTEDGRRKVAFSNEDGHAQYLFPEPGVLTLQRVAPVDEPRVQWGIAIGCTAILALVLVWPVSSYRRRGRTSVAGETAATLLAWLTAAMLLGFVVVIAGHIENPRDVLFGTSQSLERLLWVPVAAAGLLVLQLMVTYRAWVRGYWWPLRRIHYTLVTFAGLAFVAWLNYWQLVAVPVPV